MPDKERKTGNVIETPQRQFTFDEAQQAGLTEEEMKVALMRGLVTPPNVHEPLEQKDDLTSETAAALEEIERKAMAALLSKRSVCPAKQE